MTGGFAVRFTVLLLGAGTILAALWLAGIASAPFAADETGMARLSAALAAIGTGFAARRSWRGLRWIANTLPYLGLIGTTAGLILLSASLAGGASVDDARTLLEGGMGTALYPNLVAAVGYVWLSLLAALLGRQEV